ncbi:MAG: hypothetical protein AAGJ18_09760 [Bacteroidota bacterium]
MLNTQSKVALMWLLLPICISIHTVLETVEHVFFSEKMESFGTEIPTEAHFIYIVALLLPLILAFLSIFIDHKGFRWFSLIYAGLLTLLNVVHLAEIVMTNIGNITQVILLLFVVVVSVLLLLELNKWRKVEMA